jgi:hypothetical protein
MQLRESNMKNVHITPEMRADPEYGAALIIFDKIKEGHSFIDVRGVGIDKEGLLNRRGWSSGEWIMVRIALDLFDRGCVKKYGFEPASVGEMVHVLDTDWYRVVLEAVNHRRRGM